MLFKLCKRGYFNAAPWVFGQSSLSAGYEEIKDPYCSNIIKSLDPGFLYAFNSILDSYETRDTESLKQCLEGNLFSYVEEGFSKLSKENIEFKRLHRDTPIIIPLTFSFNIGPSINRSENSRFRPLEVITIGQKGSGGILQSVVGNIGRIIIPSRLKELTKNSKYFIYREMLWNVIFVIEVAFVGKKFLSLMRKEEDLSKNYSGNYFHIFKFEANMKRASISSHFDEILSLSMETLSQPSVKWFGNEEWIITDIDNQLGGNPYFNL
jgi:hypothetical protein